MSQTREINPRAHVVVVDDEDDLCELIALRLRHHGYRVSTERTARGCLEIFEREQVDAMIVDLRLERENGLDLLSVLLQRSADLPIIILTAHGTIETAVEAMRRGAYGFLTKPFDDHELLQKLEHAVERIALRREVAGLRRIVGAGAPRERLLGTSVGISHVREVIARVAPTDASVLILGESGTGKEVAARSIHELSLRATAPFVAVNCGALPADLLESELFGYVKGAFTGASRNKDGLLAAAEGGTLFLDEVGDAPLSVQVKLLRVLQERVYLRLGSTDPISADVRILAATNRELGADIENGRFREDLFYRLHVVPLRMPPLRECREDIPLLAEVFLSRAAAQHNLGSIHAAPEAVQALIGHTWPGNVRELANVVEGAAVLCREGRLGPEQLSAVIAGLPRADAPTLARAAASQRDARDARSFTLISELDAAGQGFPPLRVARDAFDRFYLEEALRRAAGNVSTAAKMAGRNRTDFHDLLRRHALQAADFRDGSRKEE
ncbi:MAG TPA: sigma-54 dependent transcriptional regulator [Polyangiaceae bacterium]|nr:sigma-54 dependent transcriptional regulator [Polyangiaceae bacterium]